MANDLSSVLEKHFFSWLYSPTREPHTRPKACYPCCGDFQCAQDLRKTAVIDAELRRFMIAIASLQEPRLPDEGSIRENHYTFFMKSRGAADHRHHGVGLKIAMPPLPFPPCRADNIDCLRRGLRTFFFLMDSGYKGMMSVDPMIISSVAVSLPEQELSILMRRVNVTGARWTRLAERKFHLADDKNGVTFKSDLHITGEITINTASRVDPIVAFVTIDTQDVESNITYAWTGRQGIDNEDYILIDRERIAVRNTRAPTFFVQPNTEETLLIEQILNLKPSILEHFTNEITNTLMHTVMDNFRLFARKVPVKYYYEYIV